MKRVKEVLHSFLNISNLFKVISYYLYYEKHLEFELIAKIYISI